MISSVRVVATLLLALQCWVANGKPYYGRLIGQLDGQAHSVAGTVYAVNEVTIMIRDFTYDGTAPSTALWVGTSDSPDSSGQALVVGDASQSTLSRYDNAVLVVSMPQGSKITDFKWLSVWCRSANANFGHVNIPANFALPAAYDLGVLMDLAHQVMVDRVVAIDSNTLRFENLMYDGLGPDTYFWAGEGATPNPNGIILTWTEGDNQVIPPGRAFTGETITVTIPKPTTIYDLGYVGLWCKQATASFGHLVVNASLLNVPADISQDRAGYYGRSMGELLSLGHGVQGKVFAVDQTRIMVRDFTFDGAAPDTFFWVGNSPLPSAEGMPLYLDSSQMKLGQYDNDVVVIELPQGVKITDYKWLSLWCRSAGANFGYLNISADFKLPHKQNLGRLVPLAHLVEADHVYVLNSQTFLLVNFVYDGMGPDTYFWAGNTVNPNGDGFILRWKNGNNQILPSGRPFTGENVTVSIPPGKSILDISYIGVWCDQAKADFGHIKFNPQALNVPAVLMQDTMFDFTNCAVMVADVFHVSWVVAGSRIHVRLSGRIGKGDYLSFGLSGSNTRTLMDGSDVAVVWEKLDGRVGIVDYHLESKQQCTLGTGGSRVGACEDTVSGGTNDVEMNSFQKKDGIQHFTYTRRLVTGDGIDKDIPLDREVYISWAIGSINPDGRVAKHSKAPVGDVKINFGAASSSPCPAFTSSNTPPPKLPAWPKQRINNVQDLRMEIGQNGGQRGYESLTGQVGWGIAWYANGLLVPEIYVVRGVNYTFSVFGGDNPSRSASYHPFYITNDAVGGYAQQSEEEKRDVVIYSGPYSGPYCEWVVRQSGISPDSYNTFEAYKQELSRECQNASAAGTTFTWTPDATTPNVVYYQCYTHRFLGWKIYVTDEPVILPPLEYPTEPPISHGSPLCSSVVMLVVALMSITLM